MSLPNIQSSKIGIIYVYYERVNEQKNQTNLSFFLKYGLNEKIWSNLNIETLIVVNGHQCEVIIPTKPNIHVLKEDNCSDWEGWYNGIKYFENKYSIPIWKKFDYLCLINAGTFGPIYENNINDHWLLPFYNKMVKDGAIICCPSMSFLSNYDAGGTGPKVLPTFSLIRCTENIINILINQKIKCVDITSTAIFIEKNMIAKYNTDCNTVLGPKFDKIDAILTGEYGISRILIQNGFKITSLLYNFDCHDPKNWNINNFMQPDRYMSFNGQNIPLSTIFIKNIWRCEDNYASLPVLYNECMNYMYSKLNMKPILAEHEHEHIIYNYDLLNININKNKNNYFSWKNNQEFYEKFGYAEEMILYNKPSRYCPACMIYAHYDKDDIIKDYVIQTIKTFIYLGYDILFFTASNKIKNVNVLPCKIFYVHNKGAGTDWNIWLLGCNYIECHKLNYDYIFLLNDSLILPINGINNFEKTIKLMRSTSDFWGHWESNEIQWHIITAQFEFKYNMINDIIQFIEQNVIFCKNKANYIHKCEIKFSQYLIDKGYKSNTVIKTADYLNLNVTCPVFNPININNWIKNPNAFAIKWKYNISYLNKNIVTPELNYLTRYLYYGKYGIISDPETGRVFPKSNDENN
jgi:hypothetical protein